MDNHVRVTKKLLDLIHVKNTSQYVSDSIMSHPDHQSLLAITDTLDKYSIHHLAVKIDFEKLQEIPLPCIVQVNINRNPLLVVLKTISKNEVRYFDDKNKLIIQSKQDFMAAWSGIFLAVEATPDSKEPNIKEKLASKRTLNVLMASLVVLVMGWILLGFINSEVAGSNSSYMAFSIVYTILKLIGLSVGIAQLWFEVDRYNPVLQNFCSGGYKKINCNAVLDSKQVTLFNNISLSLLGFSYFFGSLSYLLISGFSSAAMAVLGMLSFMTLPIILISIYYQAVVLKQWCKFCIIIQAVLIGEIGIAYFSRLTFIAIAPENLFLLLAFLLISILGWKLIKPLLKQEKEVNVHKRALKKIKNNPDVLEGLLAKSNQIKTSVKGLGITLYFGYYTI